ncbi:MAG: hypothetical protein AB7H81_25330 [Vicinamibacterales bacterium]
MHRRHFLAHVPAGIAAACVSPAITSAAPRAATGLTIRFVGMMGLVERSDGSMLAAMPSSEMHHELSHRPFLMARAGSRVGAALGLRPAPGVVPAAFDMRLEGALPDSFVFRCLGNSRLDVRGGDGPLHNRTSQPAQMGRIVKGARVRSDIERWASSVVSLEGGELTDAAAHPDAGRVWSFGSYRQRLTDAVDYASTGPVELRLTRGAEVTRYIPAAEAGEELWVVSAATARRAAGAPTRLEHSRAAFEFLAEGDAVIAECPEASGREVPVSEIPCDEGASASATAGAAARRFPPYTELCYIIIILGSGK